MKMKHMFGATAIAMVLGASGAFAQETTVIGVSIPAAGEILETSGQSTQLSGIYTIPLPEILGYSPDFRAGFDFKSTNIPLFIGEACIRQSSQ